MKKKIGSALALIMCGVMLAGCGQNKAGTDSEKTEETEETAKEETEKPEEKFKDRESVETTFFTIYYPKEWKYDEEDMSNDEDYASVPLFNGEDWESSGCSVRITALAEDTYAFRKDVIDYGIELKDFADGKTAKISLGDVEYTDASDADSEEKVYLYRHEPSAATYTVYVTKMDDEEAVKQLLEGLVPELKDEGKEEAPWPWDGEPITPVLTEQMVGTYTIVPEYIPFSESLWTTEIMEHQFVKKDNQLFHLLGNKLDTYEYADSGIKYVSTMELEDEYEYLSFDNTGMLYLSQGVFEVIGVKDGKQVLQTNITGDLNMHPSGEWGISSWVSSDTQKVTNQGGTLTVQPWILTGLNKDESRQGPMEMIDDIQITDSHIMLAGLTAGEESEKKIIIYDYDNNQLMELGGTEVGEPDLLGSITGMAETANGFVAADGNMRSIQFWAKDGTHIGAVDVEELLGTSYPWIEDMQLLEDGSLLIMLTQEREDGSSDELMCFRLTGF